MTESTARADLTTTIRSVTDTWDEPLDEVHDIAPVVNAILAAQWSSPDDTNATRNQAIAYNSLMWQLAIALGYAKEGDAQVEVDFSELIEAALSGIAAGINDGWRP